MEDILMVHSRTSLSLSAAVCAQYVWTKPIFLKYRAVPETHASKGRHQVHDHDGNLHLCDVNPVDKIIGNISFNLTDSSINAL